MKYSDAYKKTLQAYKAQGKEYLKRISSLTPPQLDDFMKMIPKGGIILDVGCAGGRDSKKFIENGFSVIGIDVVVEFLEEAKKDVPKAEFLHMNLLEMDFPEQSFEGIWSTAVLLHIQKEDMPKVLGDYYKLLKPAGKLFIGLKVGEGSAYLTDKLSEEKRFFVYYKEDEIIKLLKEAGFKTLQSDIAPSKSRGEKVHWIRLIAEKV